MARKQSVADATKILNELLAKQATLIEARKSDEAAMAETAYEANVGNEKAAARLESLQERTLRRDLEYKNLATAIQVAREKVALAQAAEAQAGEMKVAEELLELSTMMREAGNKCDRALKLLAEGSDELRKIVQATNQRGLGNPSAQQLQSLGSRAILATIIGGPYAKDFPHVSPAERKSFVVFTEAWAQMIERAVAHKLNKGDDAKNVA